MLAICQTWYSLQTGVISPRDWARAAAERGYRALGIADINGLYGAVEFSQAVEACGLQPIIGCFLRAYPGFECMVLVTSERGYGQCCRLVTARHTVRPFSFAAAASSAGVDELLFLSRSPGVVRQLEGVVPRENLFLLEPESRYSGWHTENLWDRVPVRARRLCIPVSWFLEETDRAAFATLGALRRRGGVAEPLSDCHDGVVLPRAAVWQVRHPANDAVFEIMERCHFRLGPRAPLLPRSTLPPGMDAATHLADRCRRGLVERYQGGQREVAAERLQRELAVIDSNGFADYFLYVNEIISFAFRRGISVGIRGSAASCLVSYLLGFTQCCPLEYSLCFERFMNPGRRDCPDIDIDIADNRRDEVIDFCYRRWGKDHVAMVATIQRYRSRGALRDAARVLGVPRERLAAILDGRAAPARALATCAAQLLGKPRHVGIHCGGLLITPCPLTDVTPLARAAKGWLISHYEKEQAATIGLVKMDLLGNSALSVIEAGCAWLGRRGDTLDEPGPVHDYKVNRLFAKGDTLGIYQCESPGMRHLCRALAPENPRDVAAALSLIRPGPAAAGMKEVFIRRRRGLEAVTYLHPGMAEFLQATYGVMLYQEDVMTVAVKLAGYSLADADLLRRAVSKSRGQGFLQQERRRFVFEKSPSAGVPAAAAERIWDAVSRFASYSYCKAHATVYARLAWLMARLKAHHPREFYAAILSCHQSMYPLRVFVWDALRHGIPVFPPNITLSEASWKPLRNGVLAGFDCVRGLSRKTLEQVLGERGRAPFRSFRDLLGRVSFQAGELERVILVGACRDWGERRELLRECRSTDRAGRQLSLLAAEVDAPVPLAEAQLLLTGIPFSAHPTEFFHCDGMCAARDMPSRVNSCVSMVGILNSVKVVQAEKKAGTEAREMSFLTLEDASGVFDVVLFPDTHARYRDVFCHLGPFVVRGIVVEQWGSCSLELHEVELPPRRRIAGECLADPVSAVVPAARVPQGSGLQFGPERLVVAQQGFG